MQSQRTVRIIIITEREMFFKFSLQENFLVWAYIKKLLSIFINL